MAVGTEEALSGAAHHALLSATAQDLDSHRPLITGYVRGRVRTREDAEDIVQTVFTRALGNLSSFRGECPVSHWLLRIALNELRLYYSRVLPKSNRLLPLEDFDACVQQNAEDAHPSSSEGSAMRILQAAKAACTPVERRVLTMFYRGESFEAIAVLLDMRPATVRSHFLRARANLLSHLVAHEPDIIGGPEAIRLAAERASQDMDPRERESLRDARHGKVFRSACMKLARFLPAPAIVCLMLEVAQ